MVARLSCSCLSKTMDEMRFMKRQEPDTPMKAGLALLGLGLFGRVGRQFASAC
jgi:MYXO-CTERM domain-containing protein